MMEFELDGKKYKSGNLDAFTQTNLVKRLAPVLGGIMTGFTAWKSGEIGKAIGEFAQTLAKIPDADVEYIQKTCLSTVYRQQAEGLPWAKVYNGGVIAFDDVGLLELNEIVFHVVKDQLQPFISGLTRRGWVVPA